MVNNIDANTFVHAFNPGNPFHDGQTVHSHQGCAFCHKIQRCELEKLNACAGCGTELYCSRDCQLSHWSQHKPRCKVAKNFNKTIVEKTNVKNGYTDLARWIEYYATPIKNCLIAALNLPHFPHQERHSALVIQITHKGDIARTLPLERRFTIDSIHRHNRVGEGGLTSHVVAQSLDSEEMMEMRQFGASVELGGNYYGTGMFLVLAVFSPDGLPLTASDPEQCVSVPISKFFSIPSDVARANVISGPWWPPLRRILENGERLRFCCKKLDGGVCCCGGWLHEKDAKKGDLWR